MWESINFRKKRCYSISFVILQIYATWFLFATIGYSSQNQLRIGIIGDQTGTEDIDKAYAALEKGVSILANRDVDLLFHIGDIVESKMPDQVMAEHFMRATGLLDSINKPWYLTPGDHDVNPVLYQPDSTDRRKENIFGLLYSERNQKVRNHLYYSFDVGRYHVVSLYSQEALHTDPRWGNTFLARISDEQFSWLAEDLKYHKDTKGIVVFIHQPLWYNWSGWMRVHQLLKQYPVLAVVAGHYHYDQEEGPLDGIHYVVVGATGGSLKSANRDGGNAWHVTVLTIKDSGADFELIGLDDQTPLKLTPRVDMDRVQTLDTMLSRLRDFSRNNPLYLAGNTLVNSCDGRQPARLKLADLGNPIDLPVALELQFFAKDIELALPKFSREICRAPSAAMNCTIAPGKGIALSNLSLVKSTFNWMEPPAVWTALPVIQANRRPVPGTVLNLRVRIWFSGQSGEYFVDKRATTTLKACAR